MTDERRRSEHLGREVIWTEQERERFRHGLEARRGGDGISAKWSHDEKSVYITGRDTILIALLATALGFIVWGNLKAFGAIEAQHGTLLAAQDNLACVLLMPQEARNRYRGDPGRVCDYFRIQRADPPER